MCVECGLWRVLDIVEYFQNFICLPEGYLHVSDLPKELYVMEWFFFLLLQIWKNSFAHFSESYLILVFNLQKPKEQSF